MTTGLVIKLLRTTEKLSQTDLANRLGITRAYLSQIENDKKQAGLPLLKDISRELRIPLALLVLDKDQGGLFSELREILEALLSARLALRRGEAK